MPKEVIFMHKFSKEFVFPTNGDQNVKGSSNALLKVCSTLAQKVQLYSDAFSK